MNSVITFLPKYGCIFCVREFIKKVLEFDIGRFWKVLDVKMCMNPVINIMIITIIMYHLHNTIFNYVVVECFADNITR